MILLLATLLGGCAREPPHYFNFAEKFRLVPTSVLREGCGEPTRLTIEPKSCHWGDASAQDEYAFLCFHPESTEIMVAITNKARHPVHVDFKRSEYIDELGNSHGISPYGDDMSVSPEGTRSVGFAPVEKVYFVRTGPLHEEEYGEPLIPFSMKGLSFQEVEQRLDDVAVRQQPVILRISLEGTPGCDPTYEIGFILEPRYTRDQWEQIRDF